MFRRLILLLIVLVVCGVTTVSSQAFAAEDAHGAEGGHGVSLPMDWRTDLALFSLITFAVYVAVLKAGAWEPLRTGLNDRERLIKQNIADAETNRLKSETLLKDYEVKLSKVQEEVRDILAEARRDAEHTKQEIV